MSISPKDRALRRLRAQRGQAPYDPRPTSSQSGAFANSPIVYYKVYDNLLAPIRKNVTYAHSLEELYYMAIDNAHSLKTLDTLFSLRPDFSARTMTIRDLILTSFIGTSDGKVNTMLVCPYQGDTPYDPDTTLYATVMSEMLPNSRQTPLRIALNPPASMRTWSHVSKLSMFGASVDSKLNALNTRVNRSQVVELRNDPEGSIRYSKKALAEIEASKRPKAPVAKPVVAQPSQALSNGAEAGTAVATSTTSEVTADTPVQDTASVEPEQTDGTNEEPVALLGAVAGMDDTRAPIALVTDEPVESSTVDVTSISAPLEAARLEDNTTTVADKMAVEANESNAVFTELESTQKTETVGHESSELPASA